MLKNAMDLFFFAIDFYNHSISKIIKSIERKDRQWLADGILKSHWHFFPLLTKCTLTKLINEFIHQK